MKFEKCNFVKLKGDAMRSSLTKICPVCGKQFDAFNEHGTERKFDSESCRYKFHHSKLQEGNEELKDTQQVILELKNALSDQEAESLRQLDYYTWREKEHNQLRNEVKNAVEDMRLMFSLGVLGMNRNSPNYHLLSQHDRFLRLMEDYVDNRDPRVREEEKQLRTLQKHSRYAELLARRRGDSIEAMNKLRKENRKSETEMRKHCQHYLAWVNIEDMKNFYRDQYEIEIGDNHPDIKKFVDILNDVTPGDIK